MGSINDDRDGRILQRRGRRRDRAPSGIGLALAETMLSYGAKKVILADINDENLRRETARLDTAYPGRRSGSIATSQMKSRSRP
jgi:hypothetical protein